MGLKRQVRRSFITGVLLVAPLAITLFVLNFAFGQLVGVLDPIVQETSLASYTANVQIAAQVLAALLILGAVTILGYLAQRSIGVRVVDGFDRLIGLIPIVSVIYTGVRQVGNALVDRNASYDRVVLVEYPHRGVFSIGFVTGDAPEAAERIADQPVYNVFMPASPNPTGGKLVMAAADRIHETDMNVRRGLRLLVTTGIADTEAELRELQEDSELPTVP